MPLPLLNTAQLCLNSIGFRIRRPLPVLSTSFVARGNRLKLIILFDQQLEFNGGAYVSKAGNAKSWNQANLPGREYFMHVVWPRAGNWDRRFQFAG